MSVEIRGMQDLLRALEQQYGQANATRITDPALIEAANNFKTALASEFQNFKDTGASINEMTLTEPYWKDGVRTITMHWKGPKGRYRVIHLNEFGTVRNPNPSGKGAIARTLQSNIRAYNETIKQAIRRGL